MSHDDASVTMRRWALRVVAFDVVAVCLAVLVAQRLRFGDTSSLEVSGAGGLTYGAMAVILAIAWMIVLAASQAYRPSMFGVGADEYRRVFNATCITFGMVAVLGSLFRFEVARGFLAIAFPIGLVLLLIGRLFNRRRLVRLRAAGGLVERVVVVGSPAEVRHVAEGIARFPAAGYQVVAVATDDDTSAFELSDGRQVPQLGSIVEASATARSVGAQGVVVAGGRQVSPPQIRQLGWDLEGSGGHLVLASQMTDIAGPRIHWRRIEGLPLMSVELPQYNGVKYVLKRVFDVCFATVSVVLLSPVMLAVALAVKIDSRGPIFFRQPRIGMGGKPFKMTKFRSMADGAHLQFDELAAQQHEGNVVQFKLKADPRITRVGKVIRRTSLDELPQLFDVIRGTMSLVGPRPHVQREVDSYAKDARRRLYVRPGITGAWQVGGRSNLTWDESVRKDLYYVENWSMAGDIVILAKTVRAVVGSDGAY